MARIDDFGEKIDGAAKDRWQHYMDRLAKGSGEGAIRGRPLSESFPEPPYKALLKDGGDPETIAFIRAARDLIPSKPRQDHKLRRWEDQVRTLRGLCRDLIEGRAEIDDLRDRLKEGRYRNLSDKITARSELYLGLGHDRSMKGYRLTVSALRRIDGETFDPPVKRWCVQQDKAAGISRILVTSETKQGAIEAFREKLEGGVSLEKRPKLGIYTYDGSPERGAVIGQKNGRDLIEIETHDTVKAARERLRDGRDELEEKLRRLRDVPPERSGENADRTGPALRDGDVSPEMFSETFGLRGVQFGNYVEGPRRQEELNRAYDALMDLSNVLDCHPSALSLDGELGLAFGARGRGGKGAASAHYEPVEVVINLTKRSGAGSLAHEWFHALDNHVARSEGGGRTDYASATGLASHDTRRAFKSLRDAVYETTGVVQRSRELDRTRSTPYFGTSNEVTARCFEAWVTDTLEERGIRNDYLANFVGEAMFEAEARLRGQPDGRYPYPRDGEMREIRVAYTELFTGPGLSAVLGAGPRAQVAEGEARTTDETPATAQGRDIPDGQFTLDF